MKTFKILLSSFVLLCLLQTNALAQNQKAFGLTTGVNFANWSVSAEGVNVSFDSRTAPQFGAFLRLPINGTTFIQPEVSYIGRGFKLTELFTDINGETTEDDATLVLNYLDFGATYQALLGQNNVKFLVGAGPIFGYALDGKTKSNFTINGVTTEEEEDIEFEDSGFNRLDLSIAALAGVQFDLGNLSLFVEGRYQLGILDLAQDDADTGFDEGTSITNRGIGAKVGVVFPIGGN